MRRAWWICSCGRMRRVARPERDGAFVGNLDNRPGDFRHSGANARERHPSFNPRRRKRKLAGPFPARQTDMTTDFQALRNTMVEQQVRPWEVLDPRVLAAMTAVPREEFVPAAYRSLAYADLPLPLAHGEVMLKPVVEGRLLQALELRPEDEVLEIGTGSGYVTACLAHLARAVMSLDAFADVTAQARARLDARNISNVRLETGDAFAWTPGREFDAIAITGALAETPEAFARWLKPGGRLFAIVGRSPVQTAYRYTWRGETLHAEPLFETDIPYLRGAEPVTRFTL
jgi:protein-L-isoaspartate(D-aspartate) O-methyltransferase